MICPCYSVEHNQGSQNEILSIRWGWLVSKSCPTLVTPWTIACQALSMRFPKQEYRSALSIPSPGDLPDRGIEPRSVSCVAGDFLHWKADSLPNDLPGKPKCQVLISCEKSHPELLHIPVCQE